MGKIKTSPNSSFVNHKVIDKGEEIRRFIFSNLEKVNKITDIPLKGVSTVRITLFPENGKGKNGKNIMIKVLPIGAWKGALFPLHEFKAFVKEIKENEEKLVFLINSLNQENKKEFSSGELEI